MALHLQQTIDGREETIPGALVEREEYNAEPLFTFPQTPRGSIAFDLDADAEPTHAPMRAARVRRMRLCATPTPQPSAHTPSRTPRRGGAASRYPPSLRWHACPRSFGRRRVTSGPIDNLAARAAALRAAMRPPEVTRERAAVNATAWRALHPAGANPWQAESRGTGSRGGNGKRWWCLSCGAYSKPAPHQCAKCRHVGAVLSEDNPLAGNRERRARLQRKHRANRSIHS